MTVYCGGRNGAHKTLTIFRWGGVTPQIISISLDFGRTTPNLKMASDRLGYLAKVDRTIQFSQGSPAKQNCHMYYKLRTWEESYDTNLYFAPFFGTEIAHEYCNNYLEHKDKLIKKIKYFLNNKEYIFDQFAGSLLSSLVSTQDKIKYATNLAQLRILE